MQTKTMNIVVYTPLIKLGFRDLMNARVLETLDEKFNVYWFVKDFNDKIGFFTETNTFRLKSSSFRQFIWSFLFELENYLYNNEKIGSRQSFPFLGMGYKQIAILKFIIRWHLVRLMRFVLKAILRITVSKPPDFLKSSDLVICFGSSKDFFFDDIVRMARRFNKKVMMVSLNWDNATSKPYVEKPDLVLTWGKQTASLSTKLHGIDSQPIGTPRFENYKYIDIFEKSKSRNKLGLKGDFTYVLFAGVGFPFPEIEVLNRLSEYLDQTDKSNFRILYRPHPYGWKRQNQKESDLFRKYVLIDPTLSLFEENDLDQYRYLFAACDAFLSAYSTMLVEAALHGLPILAIAFNDGTDKYFDWVNHANVAPHLQILYENKCIIHCHDLLLLNLAFDNLFEALNTDSFDKESAKRMALEIVYLPKASYSELLNNHINSLIIN
jgi:hypothetical protein